MAKQQLPTHLAKRKAAPIQPRDMDLETYEAFFNAGKELSAQFNYPLEWSQGIEALKAGMVYGVYESKEKTLSKVHAATRMARNTIKGYLKQAAEYLGKEL